MKINTIRFEETYKELRNSYDTASIMQLHSLINSVDPGDEEILAKRDELVKKFPPLFIITYDAEGRSVVRMADD